MTVRRLLLILPVLMVGSLGMSAEPNVIPSPWGDTFTMPLRDHERTFVTWQDATWLEVGLGDLADPTFLNAKDVTLIGKLIRTEGTRAWFYNLPAVEVSGDADLWRARIDGDNLYLFGRFIYEGSNKRLKVSSVVSAPSDQQVIASRRAHMQQNDWDGQLKVAEWVREQANKQGNREFWLASAESIIIQVVDDIATAAASKKEIKLALRAMTLCTEQLRDPGRAARVGSASWIRQSAGADEISLRMRKLDYEFVSGRWLPRSEATAAEFEARFLATPWNDADAYYKLGLWCDANLDLLPRARELSFRCFQAGFRANPRHNAIRHELGMEAVSTKTVSGVAQGDFSDAISGVTVTGPEGWQRTEPIEGDATWIDPKSETAYLTAKLLRGNQLASDFKTIWDLQISILQTRNGFQNLTDVEFSGTTGKARHLSFSYKEGRFTRLGDMVLVQNPAGRAAVRIDASYAESEQEAVRKRFFILVKSLTIPAGNALPVTGSENRTDPKPQPEPSGERSPVPVVPDDDASSKPAAAPASGRSSSEPST